MNAHRHAEATARPVTREVVEQWIEELRYALSKIEKDNPWDHKFVCRLIAEKKQGTLKLSGNVAHRIRQLHRKYIVPAHNTDA